MRAAVTNEDLRQAVTADVSAATGTGILLKVLQENFFGYVLMRGYARENRVQRAYPQGVVRWNSDAVM